MKLAAKEVRRYIYQRPGSLLPLAPAATGDAISFKTDAALATEQYRLQSDGHALVISGGSDVAVLYPKFRDDNREKHKIR